MTAPAVISSRVWSVRVERAFQHYQRALSFAKVNRRRGRVQTQRRFGAIKSDRTIVRGPCRLQRARSSDRRRFRLSAFALFARPDRRRLRGSHRRPSAMCPAAGDRHSAKMSRVDQIVADLQRMELVISGFNGASDNRSSCDSRRTSFDSSASFDSSQSLSQHLLIRQGSVRGVHNGVNSTIRRLKIRNNWKVSSVPFNNACDRRLCSATTSRKTATRWSCTSPAAAWCVALGTAVARRCRSWRI